MSETIITSDLATDREPESSAATCPVCGRQPADELIALSSLDERLRSLVTANALGGTANFVCTNCVVLFNRAQRQIESHAAVFEQTSFVLPTRSE